MAEFGYALSSEEHGPRALVENAAKAEAAGFAFLMVSDHFHPWTDKQGKPCSAGSQRPPSARGSAPE